MKLKPELNDYGFLDGYCGGHIVVEDAVSRESTVLGPDGKPFIVYTKKNPIGFDLRKCK